MKVMVRMQDGPRVIVKEDQYILCLGKPCEQYQRDSRSRAGASVMVGLVKMIVQVWLLDPHKRGLNKHMTDLTAKWNCLASYRGIIPDWDRI